MDPHQCPFARFRISSQHFALDLFVIGVIGTVTGSSIAIFWEPFWIFWSLATVYERWSAVWIERGRMATLWHQSLTFLLVFLRACRSGWTHDVMFCWRMVQNCTCTKQYPTVYST